MTEKQTRTIEEIVNYYKTIKADDFLGFQAEVLLSYLPAKTLRQFCKKGARLSDWKSYPLTKKQILKEMKEYMEFAWDKVENHRGISANRSIVKMRAWLWLLKNQELVDFANNPDNYPNYGAPILKKICEKYGFLVPENTKIERMSEGFSCCNDCVEGCGR